MKKVLVLVAGLMLATASAFASDGDIAIDFNVQNLRNPVVFQFVKDADKTIAKITVIAFSKDNGMGEMREYYIMNMSGVRTLIKDKDEGKNLVFQSKSATIDSEKEPCPTRVWVKEGYDFENSMIVIETAEGDVFLIDKSRDVLRGKRIY